MIVMFTARRLKPGAGSSSDRLGTRATPGLPASSGPITRATSAMRTR